MSLTSGISKKIKRNDLNLNLYECNEKNEIVLLTAKADKAKLKPYVVFKKAIRDIQKLQAVRGYKNVWWISSLLPTGSKPSVQNLPLLAWDNCRFHIIAETIDS